MAITIENAEGHCKIAIDGEMTIFNAQELKTSLLTPLPEHDDIEVDLSKVIEIDSAGLQIMVLLKLEALSRDKMLRFTGHSPAVREIIDLCDLGAFFGDPVVIQSQPA
jgi:anti-anti-sigma factor